MGPCELFLNMTSLSYSLIVVFFWGDGTGEDRACYVAQAGLELLDLSDSLT